ncbi:MAG: AraC family transcriptional regulator [Chloroflexi bacterium]|nr:AraC family transcriptional regulator [Chloroflexota bacterium]
MMKSKLPQRPVSGGTHHGSRPLFFDYWRVGYGNRERFALDFWVEQAGEYHCKPDHYYLLNEYQIQRWMRVFYLKTGEAQCSFDKNEFTIQAGDLLIVPPDHPFVYQSHYASQYHWFALAGQWPPVWGKPPQVLHFSPGYDAELEAKFVGIRETLILQPPGYPLKAISRFYDLMARLEALRSKSTAAASIYPEAVRNAMIFLQENYKQSFSAAEIAASVHISQSHLRALFEKWVGESPKRYHTRCRIEQARRLLRDQHLLVNDAAARVGYDDVGYFSRVFKRMTGSSPGDYRKKRLLSDE